MLFDIISVTVGSHLTLPKRPRQAHEDFSTTGTSDAPPSHIPFAHLPILYDEKFLVRTLKIRRILTLRPHDHLFHLVLRF